MTYGQFIKQLRAQVGDTRRRVHVDWTADGATSVFQMPADTFPVYDEAGSYIVKSNGVAQDEGTDYEIDKEAGTIIFASAPTNNYVVSIDSSAVYLTNETWVNEINGGIKSLGRDFFKEFTDDSSFEATPGMLSLDLSGDQPYCMAVYELSFRRGSNEDWHPVENFVNWRYDPDNNILYFGNKDAFNGGGQLKVRGLRTYELGTDIDDDVDVQSEYITVVEYASFARYWKQRYKSVIELVSKQTTENSRTPLQELIMLSDRYERDYEREKAKLKPQKPARIIPVYKEGAGRP